MEHFVWPNARSVRPGAFPAIPKSAPEKVRKELLGIGRVAPVILRRHSGLSLYQRHTVDPTANRGPAVLLVLLRPLHK